MGICRYVAYPTTFGWGRWVCVSLLVCFSDGETGVAALADLEHLAFEFVGRKREFFVAHDPASDPDGPTLYKATRLAVGTGEAGARDQVDYPDLLVLRQPYDGRVLGHLTAHDSVEDLLGAGHRVLPMKLAYQRAGQPAFLLDGIGLGHRPVEQERIVVGHQVVGDAHDLPEHLVWGIGHAYVVADGLAHLDLAVRADEERGR